MHALLGALASVLLVVALASAADDKPGHSSPTPRAAECAAQAGDKRLTGDARTQFVSDCLRRHTAMREGASATDKDSQSGKQTDDGRRSSQSEKMKTCNHEASAKNLRGEERKAFMSQCLKAEKKS